jgi:hypothetical protein
MTNDERARRLALRSAIQTDYPTTSRQTTRPHLRHSSLGFRLAFGLRHSSFREEATLYRTFAVVILLSLAACNAQTAPQGAPATARHESMTSKARDYATPQKLATLADKRIKESSGLCRSLANPDCFWTHNDKGDGPRLYLINGRGETIAAPKIDGAKTKDWEDISSFSRGEKNYVLVADTGDNALTRKSYQLYIVEEPALSGREAKLKDLDLIMEIDFRYADSRRDCEAMAVDPTTAAVYLVTKEKKRGAMVYELPLPVEQPASTLIAEPIARLDLPTVVAMDISLDGRRAIILSDETDAFEYRRTENQTWEQAFQMAPVALKMPARKQGESICYGADGLTLYLTSEGDREPLWEVSIP